MQRSFSSTSSLPLPTTSPTAAGGVGDNSGPPSIDTLFPMQMSLRHLKRTAVASVLLQNKIPGLASPVVLSILGDVLGRLLHNLAVRISHLESINPAALLLDLGLMLSVGGGSGFEDEVLANDLVRQRPFVLEQLEEFVREVESKPPKTNNNDLNNETSSSAAAFGALEATGMLPNGFKLTPSNTKIKRLAQL